LGECWLKGKSPEKAAVYFNKAEQYTFHGAAHHKFPRSYSP